MSSIDELPNCTLATYVQKSFPNFCELRTDNEGRKYLIFLFTRKNSHRLDFAQTEIARLLQDFGHTVKVQVLGTEMTLEQFEQHGVYPVKVSKTIQSKQGMYNKTSELKGLEEELAQLAPDHPRYYLLAQRVQHLRAMLSTGLGMLSPAELKASEERLRKVEEAFKKPVEEEVVVRRFRPPTNFEDFTLLTDEQVVSLTFNDLTKMGVPNWDERWAGITKRWLQTQEKTQNVTTPEGEDIPQ